MVDTKAWHEQDAFWEVLEPFLMSEERLAAAEEEVEKIVALLKIEPGARVLDLCCGIGRHAVRLARAGFVVTGVDRTRRYLDHAEVQAREEGVDVEFIHGDMRTFCRPGAFDVVLNFFTSFGYFEDVQEDRQALANVRQSLKPGGAFLLDTMSKEILARIYQERYWEETGGLFLLRETKVTQNWSWVESRWIAFRDNQRREFQVSHRIYSAVELAALLSESGFGEVETYGDLDGSPYDHKAKRLVVVARQ